MPPRFQLPRLCALAVVSLALLAPTSCARWPWAPPPAVPIADEIDAGTPRPSADEEIRAVEQAIESERARLIALISRPLGDGETLSHSPELRAIAERLPGLEEKLRVLKAKRASQAKGTSKAKSEARPQ